MSLNSYYNDKIAKLDIVDVGLMKMSYLSLSLMIMVIYPTALLLDWWAYLVMALAGAICFYIKLFVKTQKKGLMAKYNKFLKNMTIIDLGLLFFTMLFFAAMLSILIPELTTVAWYYYLAGYAVFALRTIIRTKSLALFM